MSKMVMKMMAEGSTLAQKLEEYYTAKMIQGIPKRGIENAKGKLHACFINTDLSIDVKDVEWNNIIQEVRDKNISEASVNSYLSCLRTFMKWLDMDLQLPKVKKVDTIKETYTEEELKKLLAKPSINCSYTEYRTWCIELLVCDTGMRAGSIRNIKVKDVCIEDCNVLLRHTKTNKVQLLPFSKTTQHALKRIIKLHTSADDYLFSDVYGNIMSENSLRLSVARYNKRRGVSKTSIHALRHTFAKRWLTECGGNVFTLKYMLGHSRLEQSEHYARLFDTDIQKVYQSPVEMLSRKRITF